MSAQSDHPGGADKPPSSGDIFIVRRQPGDTLFAVLMTGIACALLLSLGAQTKWIDNAGFLLQPRFWPAVCLSGFAVFALAYLMRSYIEQRRRTEPLIPVAEVLNWLSPWEYALYFMVYVFCVPWLGYLIATVLFCPLLTLRAGYRSWRYVGMSMLVGISIVLVFKTFLQVKIPGGEIYGYFPDGLRNFLIVYF